MDCNPIIEMDIHTACSLGDEEFITEIIKSKSVDVNAKNGCGWTPLMYACWGGHEKAVSLLLLAGARTLEFNYSNQSPLLLAAISGSLNIVKLTFQSSILDHADTEGKTALYYAVDFSFQEIAAYLLKEGANVNCSYKGMTPLMIAAMNGQRALVELLLHYGAHRQMCNEQGLTAHQLAVKHDHYDLVELLRMPLQEFSDLKSFLKTLSLEKYWPTFQSQNINLQSFLNLNEDDLKSLGIKLLGPRRKMSLAIAALKKHQPSL